MRINNKEILADTQDTKIIKLGIHAPYIAQKAQPGQFVVVMVKEEGERIPLTVVDTDKNEITLILEEAGLSTKLLGKLNKGDSLYALVGPLGHPADIKNYGKVILVGGGVGIAEIYPVAKGLKEKGNYIVIILGARTKDLLFLEKELKGISDELYITTDDGSYGRAGFTTDVLQELLKSGVYNLVYAVGPIPMMKKVSGITRDSGIKTVVSLNAIMLDGTGMCGSCRVTIGKEVRFTCVDGPEFDAHLVDWDELEKRNRIYDEKEKHICKLYGL
ncbi:MAG: sulfide/dihydroorotate dehydrogenase-like FAD/NAD-binding protein [Candidatus Omnitrophica bacterium]|nr:sulfide/dihydroorotate dehydrogenase-like FAD/NAD-binding protein [Candidatus Omnitrophota bacterium]